jgi:hypothetical protein
MAKFTVRRINFGAETPDDEDNGEGLPLPKLLKLKARRAAGIKEAKNVLAVLPAPGESLHCVVTARLDLADIIHAILEKCGRCDRMTVATLGYGPRNLRMMLGWLDAGAVGTLTLLASIFFRAHNGELWESTLAEFRSRKQRAACCHSHAKVVTLAFASGARLSIEGSSNLRANGSAREQAAIIHDAALHDWHAAWIEALVSKHEQQAD